MSDSNENSIDDVVDAIDDDVHASGEPVDESNQVSSDLDSENQDAQSVSIIDSVAPEAFVLELDRPVEKAGHGRKLSRKLLFVIAFLLTAVSCVSNAVFAFAPFLVVDLVDSIYFVRDAGDKAGLLGGSYFIGSTVSAIVFG